MSSNPPKDRHDITKVRRMARRAFNKIERMNDKRNSKFAHYRKNSVLNKELHPRSSLDELLWD